MLDPGDVALELPCEAEHTAEPAHHQYVLPPPDPIPPQALDLATTLCVNRLEASKIAVQSKENTERVRVQQAIQDRLAARKKKKAGAAAHDRAVPSSMVVLDPADTDGPSLEEAVSMLANAAHPAAPPETAQPAEGQCGIEVPECVYFKQTDDGFAAVQVSGEALVLSAESDYSDGEVRFKNEEYAESSRCFCRAGGLMMAATLVFHAGTFSRKRASQAFVQMALCELHLQDAPQMLKGAEAALALDEKLAMGWALRAQALRLQGERGRACVDAGKALSLVPEDKGFAALLLVCMKMA
eukprot:TRINITY_DN10940_c0_g1_i1.p1 TRINITY_DN10940_c0_g1~~TRINITY_DN10940_c0_g1_i1.p1  ORF type:complete len:298 (+),score=81.13 TRINITY_DN10940_c0_g1_i1:170-1063(+)